jgi:hypothetical protein
MGFLIGTDPPEGMGAYARRMMAGYLAKQNRQRPGQVCSHGLDAACKYNLLGRNDFEFLGEMG